MAYIDYRHPSALPPSYQRLHDRLADQDGNVDNVVRIHSVNPPAMRHHIQLYEHAMRGPSPLSEMQREMIAITVSATNDCFYWIVHHGAGLRRLGSDHEVVRSLARANVEGAGLGAQDAAMLAYAVRLTRAPHEIGVDDVRVLRDHGFDDAAIHDIAHVTSYYNYVNRMADGLGVELEDTWAEADMVLSRAEFEGRSAGDAPE